MKVSNIPKRAIVEWIAAILLVVISYKFSFLSYGSFFPLKAHEQSERTYHYGPSKIIKTIDFDGQKIYLCRYKDWFSADTIKKEIIKWYPGDGVGGTPIDNSNQVSFNWSGIKNKQNKMDWKFYGYASDAEITTVQLLLENETAPLSYDLDESRMFIFYWVEANRDHKINYLRGLNKDGKIIYEKKFY